MSAAPPHAAGRAPRQPALRPAMLDRLLPPTVRARLRSATARWAPGARAPAAVPGAVVLPGLDTRPAPMRPLRPPAATNDNPLRDIHDAVERDLRASGHLR